MKREILIAKKEWEKAKKGLDKIKTYSEKIEPIIIKDGLLKICRGNKQYLLAEVEKYLNTLSENDLQKEITLHIRGIYISD